MRTSLLLSEALLAHAVQVCIKSPSGALPSEVMSPGSQDRGGGRQPPQRAIFLREGHVVGLCWANSNLKDLKDHGSSPSIQGEILVSPKPVASPPRPSMTAMPISPSPPCRRAYTTTARLRAGVHRDVSAALRGRATPRSSHGSHGLSTEQFPVSAYAGSSKNLKDLKDDTTVFDRPTVIARPQRLAHSSCSNGPKRASTLAVLHSSDAASKDLGTCCDARAEAHYLLKMISAEF